MLTGLLKIERQSCSTSPKNKLKTLNTGLICNRYRPKLSLRSYKTNVSHCNTISKKSCYNLHRWVYFTKSTYCCYCCMTFHKWYNSEVSNSDMSNNLGVKSRHS